MGTIYLITNKLNGKAYVGQTGKPLEKRLNQHRATKLRAAAQQRRDRA